MFYLSLFDVLGPDCLVTGVGRVEGAQAQGDHPGEQVRDHRQASLINQRITKQVSSEAQSSNSCRYLCKEIIDDLARLKKVANSIGQTLTFKSSSNKVRLRWLVVSKPLVSKPLQLNGVASQC